MKVLLFANSDWYLYNFRLSLARRLRDEGNDVIMVSPHGEYGAHLLSQGFRWVVLPMDRASVNPARELTTMVRLIRILQKEKPDVLHNFTLKCAVYGSLAARVAGVPALVNGIDGLGYVFASRTLRARLLRPLVKVLMRLALNRPRSVVILQNPDDVEAFGAERLTSSKRIRLILSCGVDTERFRPGEGTENGERLRVLLAARLLEEKGVREFARAGELLRKEGRNVELLLAGTPDSGNASSVRQYEVEEWVARGAVRWLGHVADMPTLLRSVHAVALPSYYREGVPRSLLEGAASGLAIITTDRPGCREVVRDDGVDGLRVPIKDSVALAKAIARLDDDRVLLRGLGRRARLRAVEDFDERVVIRKTIASYGEVLGSAVAPTAYQL